uniref:Peptidase A1 domain-containing protein n=1 Tax=Oryza barthii TaxID=65489 RepID=A0A0D3GQ86_9ORYZ
MVSTGDAAAVGGGAPGGQWGRGGGGRNGARAPPPPATHEAGHEAAWAASSSAAPARRPAHSRPKGWSGSAAAVSLVTSVAAVSLVTQLRGAASLGRRLSYCLVPHSVNISSALNFGALANVTVPGAASTPLVAGDMETYYTMVLDSVEVGNKTVASVASSRIVVDSGTTLTFLDPALMGPLVDELSHRCSHRTSCCSCATSCPGGRWKPERE